MNQTHADWEKKSKRSKSNQPSSETFTSTDLPALDGSGSPEKAHCKDGFASAENGKQENDVNNSPVAVLSTSPTKTIHSGIRIISHKVKKRLLDQTTSFCMATWCSVMVHDRWEVFEFEWLQKEKSTVPVATFRFRGIQYLLVPVGVWIQ
jgi:hypothetical protein